MKVRNLIMAMTLAAGLTAQAGAEMEPNADIATQWWPQLRHVVTPWG